MFELTFSVSEKEVTTALRDAIVPSEVRDEAVTPAASVDPVRFAAGTALAVIEVLQPNPVLVVHAKALDAALQEGIARSVGTAAPLVALPLTVLVTIVASLAFVTALAAMVNASEPAVFVTSPVCAGS